MKVTITFSLYFSQVVGLGRRVLPLGHESHACLSRLGRSAASGAELNNQLKKN